MVGRVSDIDIRLLRIFVAVVDAGGFSLAVARLNLAESTVSQHMADLETRLGLRLCERGRGGFHVTPAGEEVYRLAINMLLDLEEFRDQLTSIRSGVAGTLRIGLPDGIIGDPHFPIGRQLAQFLKRYPEIQLEINMRSPRVLERSVQDGDLLLAIGPRHRRVSGLRFVPIYAEANSLYCGRGHDLFGVPPEKLAAKDVEQFDRIARGYLDRFDAQFFRDQTYRITVHQVEAAAMMILAGAGIGFLPDHFAAAYVERGELWRVKPDHFRFDSDMGAILHPSKSDEPKVSRLLKMLDIG
ncbi:MAG: LysR family transcriptional regulator [Roseitalea sp.]|jgi:DNA-binding transcriptional LysR family regulator|uniref:LysR family transcriptional regulator n=2 Tax=cellular organisms TaxID=131567 RepID=A0A3A8AB34_9HYPH|nr:LysR family transcriptional regulator [Oceaniradius stylonematis]MBO6554372.1 LysR family transcriptional regulator [Roseitalea sp.]MBO6953467.1 LysR family transcriptional regulator [Rhizobiaceae bacterium]CAJ1391357.1 unnamed protein product [Effrenium voratum]MBO6593764.1 LysR family transcriptional regulator [Roseitalea sp.]MBO6601211.1 LysR family transcriptional regulator [Roseitalea sp.]